MATMSMSVRSASLTAGCASSGSSSSIKRLSSISDVRRAGGIVTVPRRAINVAPRSARAILLRARDGNPLKEARGAVVCSAAVGAAASQGLKVLIVNTNGGGHAPIGFWLSKKLAEMGHQVTLSTVGSKDDKKMNKPPFTLFNELTAMGVQTIWADPAVVGEALRQSSFDVVIDNNGKDLGAVGPILDGAKACRAKQFLFVSSCGIYKATDSPPLIESDPVKPDAGHVGVEEAMASSGMSWASFRPQYISGYGSNKDCEEWFFDRVARGRPTPIPGSGDLLCNISNAEDLGTMIAMAVGNPNADAQIFNCVHNKGITHDGLVRLCAKVMGVECPPIVHYDPSQVGGKKAFPFRPVHFYAQPVAASALLGWSPKWTLEETLKQRWALYQELGRARKDIDFSLDDEILAYDAASKRQW